MAGRPEGPPLWYECGAWAPTGQAGGDRGAPMAGPPEGPPSRHEVDEAPMAGPPEEPPSRHEEDEAPVAASPKGPPLPYGACAGRPSGQARDEEGGSPPCGEHGAWPAPSASGPAPPRDDRCCGRKRRGSLSPCPFPNCAERTNKMRDHVTGCLLHPVFRRSVPLGEEEPGCGSGYVSGWRSSS